MKFFRSLRTYNYSLWKSIFSFSYYTHVLKAPFRFSMKFFWAFSLFLALLITLSLSLVIVPDLTAFAARFEKRGASLFPDELVIKIEKGTVSTNVTEPLRIPVPYELLTDTPPPISDQQQKYLLVIDTKADPASFKDAQTYALLTQQSLVMADVENGSRTMPLEEKDSLTIDKEAYTHAFNAALPLIRILPVIVPLSIFIFVGLLWPLGRLFMILILSVPLQLLAQLFQLHVPLKKLFQIGLHSMTLPTIIQLVFFSMGLVVPIPLFFSILYILYNLVILSEIRKQALTAAGRT